MSFILDALTRSEQARQQTVATPKFSLLPAGGAEVVERRLWPYFITAALVVNAAVLYLWLNPVIAGGAATINTARPTRSAGASALQERDAAARLAPELERPVHGADVAPAEALAREWRREGRGPERNSVTAEASTREPGMQPAGETPDHAATQPASNPIAERKVESETLAKSAVGKVSATPANSAGVPPSGVPQDFPTVSVAGYIRDEGADAMVIVNDKLVREGDEISPGLKLEKILQDGLVLNYKGQRFKR